MIFTKASCGESAAPGGGWEGGRGESTPRTPPGTPDLARGDPRSPYQGAGEACGGGSLVPGGAARAVLADVEVVHEPVAVEEAFPWGGREWGHRQSPARTPPAPNQPCLSQESTEPKLPSPKPEPGASLATTPQGRGHPGGGSEATGDAPKAGGAPLAMSILPPGLAPLSARPAGASRRSQEVLAQWQGRAKRKTPGPGRPRSHQQQLGTHTWRPESPPRAPSALTTLKHNGDRLSGAPGMGHPPAPSKKGLGTEPCRHQTGAAGSPEAVPGVLCGVEGSAPFWHPEEHGAAPQLGQQHKRQQVQGMGSLQSTPSPPPSPAVLAQLQHGAITRGRRTRGGPRQQCPHHGPVRLGTSGDVPTANGVPLEKGVLCACSRIFTTSSGVTATTAPPSASSRGAPHPGTPPHSPVTLTEERGEDGARARGQHLLQGRDAPPGAR